MTTEQKPTYGIRVTRLSVAPPGEPLFGEQCTHFTLENEASGEYIEIQQQSDHVDAKNQAVILTPEEWPVFREAIERLLEEVVLAENLEAEKRG